MSLSSDNILVIYRYRSLDDQIFTGIDHTFVFHEKLEFSEAETHVQEVLTDTLRWQRPLKYVYITKVSMDKTDENGEG